MTEHSAEWQVGTADLRRGLQAVLPHVNPDKDQQTTHRIRFELGTEVVLQATDGFTAAMYACDATHLRTFGLEFVDVTPADVTKILAVFKAGKDEDADYPDSVLEWRCTEKLIQIRDVSGMFAGHELELPANPGAEFPNVASVFRNRLTSGPSSFDDDTVQVNNRLLARFSASGKAIGGPLSIDTERSPYLITAGDLFIGALMPARITDEIRAGLRDTLRKWRTTAARLNSSVVARRATAEQLSDRLIAAVRAVGVRQAATVLGVAEALGVGKADATDLLSQMEGHGLLGPARRGKGREVLFGPDETDRVLWKIAHGGQDMVDLDQPTEHVHDFVGTPSFDGAVMEFHCPGCDERYSTDVAEDAGPFYVEVNTDPPKPPYGSPERAAFDERTWEPGDGPLSPVPDSAYPADAVDLDPPAAPVSPFIDSDGNPWPTDPFDPS